METNSPKFYKIFQDFINQKFNLENWIEAMKYY